MQAFVLLAAWSPDDRSRALAIDVLAAIDATMTRADAVDRLRLANEAQLSEQLNCRKPLNLFRLAPLPDVFWDEFLDRLATRRGGLYIPPIAVLVLKGAAALGFRHPIFDRLFRGSDAA